jgi:tellurite resistance protein
MIPAVGAIAAPSAGIPLGQDLLSALLFGQGLLGLALLLPAIIVRLSFHDRPPEGAPLIILLTPPGLGCVSLVALNGGVDHLAMGLFGAAITMAGGLLFLTPRIVGARLNINLWAAVFPTANLAIASMLIGAGADTPVLLWLGFGLTLLVSLLGLAILGWTGYILARGGFSLHGLVHNPRPTRHGH